MSPVVLSIFLTCPASQSVEIRPPSCIKSNSFWHKAACSPADTLRKSGTWQTSQSWRTSGPASILSITSGIAHNILSVARSSASRARISSSWSETCSNERISASGVPNSKRELRHCNFLIDANRWFSIASTHSGSNGVASPVTPKVPSVVNRPARPAIWANSLGCKYLCRRPSNLDVPANATWLISRFNPMPIASVATR